MDPMLRFLGQLKAYLEARRGRKARLARELRIGASTISQWCRLEPRRVPDGSNVLLILRWLKEEGVSVSSCLPLEFTATVVGKRKRRGGAADGGKRTKALKQRRIAPAVSPYSSFPRAEHSGRN